MRNVFDDVVDPESTVERKMRPTVAWVFVAAALAVGIQRRKSRYESFAPGVKARKIVEPTVPAPSLEVLAGEPLRATAWILATFVNWGWTLGAVMRDS
jgi:hypothetical protein